MKRTFYQVTYPGGGPWVCEPRDLTGFLADTADVHADIVYPEPFSFTVTPVELTPAEYEALPQWKNV